MKLLAPTKKLGRPCSSDAGETRERLIHEARASFATIGYDATTNRTVAAAAGITTGAIYHYFPSKLDMYVAAFEQVQNMVTEAVVAAAAPCDSLVDKFSAIIDALTEVSKNDASLLGFVVGVSAEARRHPELSDAIRPLRKDWAVFFQELCEGAVARGEVGSEMTARTLQDLFDVMISGLARFAYVINDREREDAVIDGLKRFVAAAVS